MTQHKEWKDAHTAAVTLARQLGREVGIEKLKTYEGTHYYVRTVPRADMRFGVDARCEIVGPGDPL